MKSLRDRILWWALLRRVKKDRPKIIAVGGAIAKTSTKTAIGTLLKLAYPGEVRVGYGNLNTYVGVPLSALGFEIDFYQQKIGLLRWIIILKLAVWRSLFYRLPRYLVLEYGTDKPDDIKDITAKLPPDIGVITIVGPAHLANYPSIEAMVKDEGYLAEKTKPDGLVLVNTADRYLTEHYQRAKARVVNVVCSLEEIAVKYMEVLGREMGIVESVIERAKATFQTPEHRFRYEELAGVNLLDDAYNASPLAVEAALHLLKKMPAKRAAILGSMLELGSLSAELHTSTGQLARKYADKIIAVGEEAKAYKADVWYASSAEAAEQIVDQIQGFASVLVKGSKGVHMEVITEAIRNHYQQEK